jgi:hypothetical protein
MGGKFYVYEHWRMDREECFYVGKGHGRRANDMARRNRFHKFIQKKLGALGSAVEVRIIADGISENEAFEFEKIRIAFWRSDGADLANLTDGGEGSSGRKHTEEEKQKISKKMTGRIISPETRAKMSAANLGKQWSLGTKKSPEAIEKTRIFHLGRKRSAETCAKISASKKGNPSSFGHKASPEAREKTRLAHLGRKRSAETCAKMRKPKSEAHRKKLSEASTGKMHSEATRKLLSEKAKIQWFHRLNAIREVSES